MSRSSSARRVGSSHGSSPHPSHYPVPLITAGLGAGPKHALGRGQASLGSSCVVLVLFMSRSSSACRVGSSHGFITRGPRELGPRNLPGARLRREHVRSHVARARGSRLGSRMWARASYSYTYISVYVSVRTHVARTRLKAGAQGCGRATSDISLGRSCSQTHAHVRTNVEFKCMHTHTYIQIYVQATSDKSIG